MKYRFIKALVCCSFILVILLFPRQGFSQRYLEGGNSFWNNVSLTGTVGTTLFFGDVSFESSPYQEDWKIGYGLVLRKQFSPIFGMGLQFMKGQLHGTKLSFQDGTAANLYFDGDLMEFNLHAVINITNLIMSENPDRLINLYAYLGIGVANWNSILRNFETNAIIETSGFDDAGVAAWTPEMIYPVGLGVNLMLTQRLDINADVGFRMVNSDEVDARATGNVKNDYYSYASLGLTYKISGTGGLFRSGKSKEINYDREARKQQRYQNRQLKKEEKRLDRKRLEDQRLEEALSGNSDKKSKRKTRDDGLPKVVEYDVTYTLTQALNIGSSTQKQKETDIGKTVASTDINVDEGKLFITGTQNDVKAQNEQNNKIIEENQMANFKDVISEDAAITIPNQGLVYTVQVLATRIPEKSVSAMKIKYGINKQIYVFKSGALYRYSAGLFNTYQEALNYSRVLHSNNLSDAFVAVYENGRRVQRTR